MMEANENKIIKRLGKLFTEWCGEKPLHFLPLPGAGSERRYYRILGPGQKVLGAYHPVLKENEAFFAFTNHFRSAGLSVPEVYKISEERETYLMEDLGDTTLFSLVMEEHRTGGHFRGIKKLYAEALEQLVRFQVRAARDLDYTKCYPRQQFDRQSMTWDLNYFKYNYLKLRNITFNEQALEDDFRVLINRLEGYGHEYFMYRDFQARNIMVRDGELFFVDYQGGRKGPLAYDAVSLLNQVRADLPFKLRGELLEHYIACLANEIDLNKPDFLKQADSFLLLRLLQVLGAYGFRGLFQQKYHFIESLPFAAKNVAWWLENERTGLELPELFRLMKRIVRIESRDPYESSDKLKVHVYSFSYRKGLPVDSSGHGGGFVFDCRFLPNPGREERFRKLTGKDPLVADYLLASKEVDKFLETVNTIVDGAVKNYLERDFRHLMVSFGCTGGQHRSVYCAEALARHLKKKKMAEVVIHHKEID